MPRKSAAALSVVATAIDHRPRAPSELSDEQAAIWREIVNRMPADWFGRETHELLVQYARHAVAARRVAQLIARVEKADELDVREYRELLKSQSDESRIIAMLATKMRLAQQSSYDTQKAGTAKKGGGRRQRTPWQIEDADEGGGDQSEG